MHTIDLKRLNTRTDLAIELIDKKISNKVKKSKNVSITNIKISKKQENLLNKKKGNYITIEFKDVTDYDNSKEVEKYFSNELKKMLRINKIKENDTCLVIGLGNKNCTPDSLGPNSIDNVVITRHMFENNVDVEKGFRNVSGITPGVMGETGIEVYDIIKGIINKIKPNFLIVIDSLKASSIKRLNKTIQITDSGINPGSGIGNNRKELSFDTLNIPVIAIGIPTVIDSSLINKKDKNNFIVTDIEIDFLIKKFSNIISNGINSALHENIN